MTPPLPRTKHFLAQRRPDTPRRRRLAALLAESMAGTCTLISAPAGFGKTTLLADWAADLGREERLVAWLSVEATDDEPHRFLSYLTAAVDGVLPGCVSLSGEHGTMRREGGSRGGGKPAVFPGGQAWRHSGPSTVP
jgi:LuxR family maltose regulon positive regulatory protein